MMPLMRSCGSHYYSSLLTTINLLWAMINLFWAIIKHDEAFSTNFSTMSHSSLSAGAPSSPSRNSGSWTDPCTPSFGRWSRTSNSSHSKGCRMTQWWLSGWQLDPFRLNQKVICLKIFFSFKKIKWKKTFSNIFKSLKHSEGTSL